MPTYEYFCDHCGDFSALRPLAERNAACACPQCGAASYRVMNTAPSLGLVGAATRTAHSINERAASEPHSSGSYSRLRHPKACACCAPGKAAGSSSATDGKKSLSKSFPAKRPWMISH